MRAAASPAALCLMHIQGRWWWATNESREGNNSYRRTAFLSSKGNAHNSIATASDAAVALHWTIDHVQSKINLEIAVKALGWVRLGFTEMGGMPGSDMIIFDAASGSLVDAYATRAATPMVDVQQDWTLVNSIVEDGFLIVEAERNLDTGDAMDWAFVNDTNYTYLQNRHEVNISMG
jgi:hypothetical protein